MNLFLIALLTLSLLVIVGCTTDKDVSRAQQYRLELQYYENSVKFSALNMNTEAINSCEQTKLLRSECFTSYAQSLIAKKIAPQKEFCEQINPHDKMNMTMNAFKLVYTDIDRDLKKELREKLNPSLKRITALLEIKNTCLSKVVA